MQSPVPALVHSLTALSRILDKVQAFEEAKKLKPEVIPQLRLIADMLPFWRQITLTSDHAKGMASRLAGRENPSFPDTETTLAELKQRVEKTIAYLQTIPEEAYVGAEARTITIRSGQREISFPAAQYLSGYGLPNFYFHMTTAYAILRANGVELGKTDFLGA